MDKYLDSVEDNYNSKIRIENKKLKEIIQELSDTINKLRIENKKLRND